MEATDINRDIVINSYYVIKYFSDNGQEITHLKLQKLMYFLEAIYMYEYKTDSMFDSEFYAWPYGPVSKELYNKFKVFSDLPIEITEQEKKLGEQISKENKKSVLKLYITFKDMTASDLVTLTHVNGSPWSKVYDEKLCADIKTECVIQKLDTLKWFKSIIGAE